MNKLDQLKQHTIVVADSGDFHSIAQFKPQDCTTNPSLILQASQKEEYVHLVDNGIIWAKENLAKYSAISLVELACEKVATNFVTELLQLVPGRVSIEVDVTASFDKQRTKAIAKRLISILEQENIPRNRILIKIATTWEGICAAKELEEEGINCNLTLLFSKAQAIACAQAKVFLVSPFVGRILDWYKKNENKEYTQQTDPGVVSVKDIYNYYKRFDYKTIVMGASFRNIGEIEELYGIDRLTISPKLLTELEQDTKPMAVKLTVEKAKALAMEDIIFDEATFRWEHNQDAMAVQNLAQGIRNFAIDLARLQAIIKEKLAQ